MQILQPFAALYVLILAILGPLLAKESKHVLKVLDKVFKFDKRYRQRLAQKKAVQE
ncbi:K(+)/H(+) antiporter YhaU [compost metagenome]